MDNYKFNNLIEYILKLKNIKRTGWLSKAKILRAESVADHSYSLTALSMVFSDFLGLDTEKVIKMCIIHDLAESIIGDYMPDEISIGEKQIKEARLVKQLDKIEMFLQANQYLKNGYSYEFLSPFLHVLDSIGAGVEKEEDNSNFQSTIANMLKHLR